MSKGIFYLYTIGPGEGVSGSTVGEEEMSEPKSLCHGASVHECTLDDETFYVCDECGLSCEIESESAEENEGKK